MIGPVDSTTTKSVQTSVKMEEAGCSKKDMSELVKEEDEDKTNENTVRLELDTHSVLKFLLFFYIWIHIEKLASSQPN